MSIPLKPWELPGPVSPTGMDSYIPNHTDNRLYSSAIPYPGSSGGGVPNQVQIQSSNNNNDPTPPVPPRPGVGAGQQVAQSPYNRSIYSPYSSGSYYSGGAGYGYGGSYYNNPYASSYPMGGYGYGYGVPRPMFGPQGSYGVNGNEITFSQLAEESSASAFQSIESFVSAFGSISAMLESTFQAVYSSFRAVVGVADHLGRAKQVFSALAIFRFIRWCYRRILYLIGISKIKPEQIESLWNSVQNEVDGDWTENQLRPGRKPSSWPILMFLGFIFAGPYLMWKLVASLNLNKPGPDNKWASGESQHFVACAEYDFATTSDRELKMKRGQQIRLAPSSQQPPNVKGWVLASDGVKIGLVPTNYIKILGKRAANPVPNRIMYNSSANANVYTHSHVLPGSSSSSLQQLNSDQTASQNNPQALSQADAEASDSETLKASRSSSTSSLFTPTSEGATGVAAAEET